jgi:DNA-binding CsgD family transcriptional regulator
MWLAGHAAVELWDDETWDMLATRNVQVARQAGALTVLPQALCMRSVVHTFADELAESVSLIDELQAAVDATGSHFPPYGALIFAAFKGREAEVSELVETITNEVVARGEGIGLTITQWATAVLYNGLGRYEAALAAAERASEPPEDLGFSHWALVELIVAAVRTGHLERAADALQRLSEMTRASGTDWALGTEASMRALLSDGETADRLHREAIDRLRRTRIRFQLARAHLRYGEWLRRERRRLDARDQLRIAHQMFAAMGIEAYIPRTEGELLATAEHTRKRTVETQETLTAQEAQVARLARDGLSNSEIGARLFISRRTVEYHLTKVFTKLNISSRNHLDRVLPEKKARSPISVLRRQGRHTSARS